MSIHPMATKARNIALAVLYSCCCAQASQPCGSAALYDQVMAAADAQMGPFVLFRGKIETLPREDKQSLPAASVGVVHFLCPLFSLYPAN